MAPTGLLGRVCADFVMQQLYEVHRVFSSLERLGSGLCVYINILFTWIIYMHEDISSGAASAHLCSHFIRIRSGPTNKLLYFCRATSWDSGCYVKICCKYIAGLIQAGCLLVRFGSIRTASLVRYLCRCCIQCTCVLCMLCCYDFDVAGPFIGTPVIYVI